ncbi:MAG: DUF3365 domain-containing protein [Thermodesulfovibrionales bacterium]
MKRTWIFIIVSSVVLSMSLCPAYAQKGDESIAEALANYLIAGRLVIANNQNLINDPDKGLKGFTSMVYEEQVANEFKKISGIDIHGVSSQDRYPLSRTLGSIHECALEVISDVQKQINEPGKGFKGFNPAVFGVRVGNKLYKKTGIKIKQTSMKYRADYNKPDDFEVKVLKKFEEDGEKGSPYLEVTTDGNEKVVRYMVPLYIEKSCLICHGDPAGELDISGRMKEGYKEGELRGAISVVLKTLQR